MNLLTARVVLRVRATSDVLDLAVPYALRGWRVMAPLALYTLVPAFVALASLRFYAQWPWAWVWIAAVLLGGWLQAPFVLGAGELLFETEQRTRLKTLAKHLWTRWWPFVFAHTLSRILLFVSMLTVIAWPLTGVSTLFVHEAALLEGATGAEAITRSRRLLARQRGAGLGLWAASLLIPLLTALLGDSFGHALIDSVLQLNAPLGDLVSDGGSYYALAGFLLSLPITVAARFLKYVDIRTRKEGWDIQLRFMAVKALSDAEARRP